MAIPVRVVQTGRLYRSAKAALRDLGFTDPSPYYRHIGDGLPIGRAGWLIDPIDPSDPDWHQLPPPEFHPKRRPHCRPVRCVETGQVFPSGNAAARSVGVDRNSIYGAIRRNGRAGGFHWTYETSHG